MNPKLKRSWILAAATVTLIALSPVTGAKMVSTSQAIDQKTANQDRTRVQELLDHTDARERLQSMGIDAQEVKARLAGLTDPEAHELAQRLDTLPAGGDISNRNLLAIVLIVLLVVLLI